MNFELTDEQQRLQDSAIEFARTALASDVRQRDRDEAFELDSDSQVRNTRPARP